MLLYVRAFLKRNAQFRNADSGNVNIDEKHGLLYAL